MLSYNKVRLRIIALVFVFQDMVDLINLLVYSRFKNVMLFKKPRIGDLQLIVLVNDENNLRGGYNLYILLIHKFGFNINIF
jgi:hypothetical protein